MAHTTTDQEMEVAFKHGMQYFLPKPIDTELMMSIINKKKELLYEHNLSLPGSPSLHSSSPSIKMEKNERHEKHEKNEKHEKHEKHDSRYFHHNESQESSQIDSDYTEIVDRPPHSQYEKTFLTGVKLFRRMSIKQSDQKMEGMSESNHRGI